MSADLDEIKASLLRWPRTELQPDHGEEALERHQILAIRFHRAARLNAPDQPGEKVPWNAYFNGYFPRGGTYGGLLWDDWRCSLLKDDAPGTGVTITHGQPNIHWKFDEHSRLCMNLESMRDDFEHSVE